jgi:two-component system, NarL family, response regulator DesR
VCMQRAMASGAKGFLAEDGTAEVLADAVRRVVAGATVMDPELAILALRTAASPLTSRERDVLVAAEDGSSVADIASRLYLSHNTVRNYLSNAIGKTGTRNKTEAALLARRNGWL